MRVLVAMSGGVDSSVAAALLHEAGHTVAGATLKLWGGESDTGCCSVADVEDARRVAQQIGIDHHVFNFTDDFEAKVVAPYVASHAAGTTPNPCVECNRHIKFDRFLRRAMQLGYDAIATGHHARVLRDGAGAFRVARGVDARKDQSYVLSMLGQEHLERVLLPVGEITKAQVRARAAGLGLRTATKPDSQDVCFITARGREAFLGERIPLRKGKVVDLEGSEVGEVSAIELITVGQRRGLAVGGSGTPLYAIAVDSEAGEVVVGSRDDLMTSTINVRDTTWACGSEPPAAALLVQTSAHGQPVLGSYEREVVTLRAPTRRVAAGQAVAFYDGDLVLGSAIAA